MGTRATISIKKGNKIKSCYLQNDGYVAWAGIILRVYYSNVDLLTKLINLGNKKGGLECIGKSLSDCGYCGRDMKIPSHKNEHDLLLENAEEYNYIYDADEQEWRMLEPSVSDNSWNYESYLLETAIKENLVLCLDNLRVVSKKYPFIKYFKTA